jgi:hypothetical protein
MRTLNNFFLARNLRQLIAKACLIVLILSGAMVFPSKTIGNIAPPSAIIREFFIDSDGSWFLEFEMYSSFFQIDSLSITSLSGSRMLSSGWTSWELSTRKFYVVSNHLLQPSLPMLRDGDFILLTAFWNGYSYSDSLKFGNIPGAHVALLPYPCSVNKDWEYPSFFDWQLSFRSSLGFKMPESYQKGYVYGRMIDSLGVPIPNMPVPCFGMLTTDNQGRFSGFVDARYYRVQNFIHNTGGQQILYEMGTDSIQVVPMGFVSRDIVFKGQRVLGAAPAPMIPEARINAFPNPFRDRLVLVIEPGPGLADGPLRLQMFSRDGRLVFSRELPAGMRRLELGPSELTNLASGVYVLQLQSGSRVIIPENNRLVKVD